MSQLYRRGSRGGQVAQFQKQLGITSDGIFGKQTDAAVRQFQQKNGLKVDGIIGPNTLAALNGGNKKAAAPSPSTPTKAPQNNSTIRKDANGKPILPTGDQLKIGVDYKDYATQLPSLEQVQKQWGLDDAGSYAEKIAEKNQQIKLDNIAAQKDLLQQNVREAQDKLEVDYFGQFRETKEQNAIRGLNSGIAEQRNTQLQMNYNDVLGGIMRDKGREEQALAREEGRVELERQAEEMQIKQQELQKQIDLAFKQGNWEQAENMKRMEMDLQKEMNRIDGLRYLYEQEHKDWWNNKEFNFNEKWKNKEFGFAQEKFAFTKEMERQQLAMQQQRLAEQRAARAADQAYRQQQLALKKSQQQQESAAKEKQRKADGQKLLTDALYEMRTGETDHGMIMKGVMNAYQDGYYTKEEYTEAIKKLNDAYYNHRYKPSQSGR